MKKFILATFFSTCSLWVHAADKFLTLPTGNLVVYASQPGEAVIGLDPVTQYRRYV